MEYFIRKINFHSILENNKHNIRNNLKVMDMILSSNTKETEILNNNKIATAGRELGWWTRIDDSILKD